MTEIQVTHVDPGDNVFCDMCGGDYTDSTKSGGILFGSKAVCPECTAIMMPDIKRYKEESYIRGHCPEGTSFADYVRSIR